MVFSDVRGGLIVFGGRNGDTYYNDLSLYKLDNNAWSAYEPTDGVAPLPRAGAAMALLTTQKRLYIFGGSNGTHVMNDLWYWTFGKLCVTCHCLTR